jgi:hypothetical protein
MIITDEIHVISDIIKQAAGSRQQAAGSRQQFLLSKNFCILRWPSTENFGYIPHIFSQTCLFHPYKKYKILRSHKRRAVFRYAAHSMYLEI